MAGDSETAWIEDPFEQEYTTGILDEITDEAESHPLAGTPRTRIAVSAEPFALRGCVLTPDRAIENGYVVVEGSTIAEVSEGLPTSGVRIIDTGGVIMPGMIDLHGHPEYNVFAAWEPPKLYMNRNQWRRSREYGQIVKEPWQHLKVLRRSLTRYAEARSLVGGVTAIQGASGMYSNKDEALVRNVDLRIFGQHRARSMIDLGRAKPDDQARIRQAIDNGSVTAFYIHIAEGIDEPSRREYRALVDANLLTPATVLIHGTALTTEHFGELKDSGAKLVWSPQSNLRLYGQTTMVAEALKLGIPVGLGADWLPSGSPSLLAEMKVAQRALADQGYNISPKRLVQMVTSDAARIAGLGQYLGRLEAGRPADILVLERHQRSPWKNVVQAEPAWVELVTIGGDLAYGRADWIAELAGTGVVEPVIAWGKQMVIDTTYTAHEPADAPPRLAELRRELIEIYPQIGPIHA